MERLQKHYSNTGQTYPLWHDNEVLINSETVIDSNLFEAQNKLYILDTYINPETTTTFNIGEGSVLKFTRNGKLGQNCIIDCNTSVEIEAGMYHIFDGCTIKCFIKNGTIYPEWWGAVADGITDDSTAINECLKMLKRNTVYLGGSFYRVKSSISINEGEVVYDHYPNDIKTELGASYILVNGLKVYVPEEHSKKIIIDGDIIGDETLSDPVIEFLGFCYSTFICRGLIHVYSTDPKCVGVYMRGIKNSQIDIARVIKRGTTKIGTAIVLCSLQYISLFNFKGSSNFANGLVIIDDTFLSTFTNKTAASTPTKLASMCSTWKCRGFGGNTYGVYIGLGIAGGSSKNSYFNDNRMYFSNIATTDKNNAIAFKVDTTVKASTNDNEIYVAAHDSSCTTYFDLMYCQGWDFHIQGNFVDMTDSNGKMYTHINNGTAITMKYCSNCRIFPKQVFYADLLSCTRCVNCKIYNVVCSETTATTSESPEIWYGLQVLDTKPKFTLTATVLESNNTNYRKEKLQDATTLTSVKVLEPERRYWLSIHYVNTLPTALTTTNHQFYALTTTEYGDMAKVYKLYDSLGREVGYVYKERYVALEA